MYNKLFTKILDSSIWLAPDPHRLVWITLIAAMDEQGNVNFASTGNLAARARVTRKQADEAVAAFEGPDPDSGDPDNDGRRIERFPGGWHVLNAHKYRALVTKAIIQEQTRARVAKHRAKMAGVLISDAPVTHEKRDGNASLTPSEALAVSGSTAEKAKIAAAPLPARSPKAPKPAPVPFAGVNSDDIDPKACALLSVDFELPANWGMDAIALGWTRPGILQEAERFRQYWVSGKGAGSRKSLRGWRQAWSNWLSKAEKMNGSAK